MYVEEIVMMPKTGERSIFSRVSAAVPPAGGARGDAVLPKPVLRRLLPLVLGLLIALTGGFGALLWWSHQGRLQKTFAQDLSDVPRDIRMLLDQQAAGLATALHPITGCAEMQKAL